MPRVQAVKPFSGFGIVYPDGVKGIRVVKTFTEGPHKIINADGSPSYSTPPPTIHELYGGGFAYASGSPVTDRSHLEEITDIKMRARALAWFDGDAALSEKATKDVPELDPDKKATPEPIYMLSSDMPSEKDPLTKDLDNQVKQAAQQAKDETKEMFGQLVNAVTELANTVKAQGDEIAKLKAPEQRLSKRSEVMRRKWLDPEWRAKQLLATKERRDKKNGNVSSESGEKV